MKVFEFIKSKSKIILTILVVILITLVAVLVYLIYPFPKNKHTVIFTLNGKDNCEIEYGNLYEEDGAFLLFDGEDKSKDIVIDNKNINYKKLGKYKIKYAYTFEEREYFTYRIINIIDRESPKLSLTGNEKIDVLVGDKYKEQGAVATDNYDGDITDKIVIEGKVDTSKAGEYKVTYKVQDSSGNESVKERIVTVKVPKKVVIPNNNENKETKKEVVAEEYKNTVTKNSFTASGFSIEGYKKENDGTFKLVLKGSSEYTFDLSSNGENKYKGSIDLSKVANGTYRIYINSKDEEVLLNKMDEIDRIVRAKVGNKLVSFSYSNDEVKVSISDFYYQYDVLIDPGHGGEDVGAVNEYIEEKEMNLTVSLYEKCRFEEHGFSVYMTRTSDTYGNGYGSANLLKLQRRALEMGYYGAVSKIVYSNHHNAIGNKSYMGYEILLPGYLTKTDLASELQIVNKFNKIYPLKEDHLRFYARDYDTEKKYSKLEGEVYTFKDNYAVNRIPYKLFNVKSLIYEGSYLTNYDDYNWYWNEGNWLKVSEAKLEVYINSLGGTYNPVTSVCNYTEV